MSSDTFNDVPTWDESKRLEAYRLAEESDSTSSSVVPTWEESKVTDTCHTAEPTDFSRTIDSGFNSYLQTPDSVVPLRLSPIAHNSSKIKNMERGRSRSRSTEPVVCSAKLGEEVPLDLSNPRKRRLGFEDVNNNNIVSTECETDLSGCKFDDNSDYVKIPRTRVNNRRGSDGATEKEERVMLPQYATKVLLAWYHGHIDKPYATQTDLAVLAKEAGIEPTQARKWLSNKRARSGNTLSKNGQMHPRKVAKIEEIKQVVKPKNSGETGLDISLRISEEYPDESSVNFDELKQEDDSYAFADNKKLTQTQRDKLETWFMQNIHEPEGPYPDALTKRELSVKLGLDHSKVVNWFCNRRSRIMPKSKVEKCKPTATVTAVAQGVCDGPSISSTMKLDNGLHNASRITQLSEAAESTPQQKRCVESKKVRQVSQESNEAVDLSVNEDVKPLSMHDAFLEHYRRAGGMSFMPPFWANGLNGGAQRFQGHADGFLASSSILPGGLYMGGVNPWFQQPPLGAAAAPMINPYTGHPSFGYSGSAGMSFGHPAMVPFFPWQVPNSTLPPALPLAGGAIDANVASRRIRSSAASSDVVDKPRDIAANAISSPLLSGSQFAPPSFADYLAFLGAGPTVIPSSSVI